MARKLEEVGDRVTNNQGFSGTIKEILVDENQFFSQGRFLIEFDSGYIGNYLILNVRRGRFSDYGQPNKVGGYAVGSGESVGPMRFVWYNMLSRCNNPKDKDYKNYGARGAKVSDRWHYLENFIEDVKDLEGYDKKIKYPDEYTLDKDSKYKGNLLYSKDTCVFINKQSQSINSRNAVRVKCILSDGSETSFDSIAEAGRKTNTCISSIGKGLRENNIYKSKGNIFTKLEDGLNG